MMVCYIILLCIGFLYMCFNRFSGGNGHTRYSQKVILKWVSVRGRPKPLDLKRRKK